MITDPGVLSGMSQDQLSGMLTSLQAALVDLMSGKQVATASYQQGDGAKSVTYRQTDVANLTALIRMVQQAMGTIPKARRSFRFRFS